jgi:lipoprotein signal peptidase
VSATVLAIDPLAKTAAPHLHIGFVLPARNPAYAFGAAGGSAPALIAGSVVALAVFLAVVGRLAAQIGVSPCLPALIAGGMLGNTLDRIRFGSVRDFLVVPGAIVNLADLAIAAGVIALVVMLAVHIPRAAHTARRATI